MIMETKPVNLASADGSYTAPLHLLSLPPEIRSTIYFHLFQAPSDTITYHFVSPVLDPWDPIPCSPEDDADTINHLTSKNILLACKSTYLEGLEHYYTHTQVKCSGCLEGGVIKNKLVRDLCQHVTVRGILKIKSLQAILSQFSNLRTINLIDTLRDTVYLDECRSFDNAQMTNDGLLGIISARWLSRLAEIFQEFTGAEVAIAWCVRMTTRGPPLRYKAWVSRPQRLCCHYS